jgi:plasmid stabilization system protein ParE
MKKYEVEFTDEALADLESSFEWGSEKWGVAEAARWYFEIKDSILETLSVSPLGCPLAPDQDRYLAETRVLIVGRYNVIFFVERNLVLVVHIRGPFTW